MSAEGVISVLKPPGMTSHDVVRWIRNRLGTRRVGHAGTLDPGAVGLLLVCVGRATRIAEYLSGTAKEYVAEVTFGVQTDTDDRWGRPVGEGRTDVTPDDVDQVLPRLAGRIMQVPPSVSAIKHRGRALYQYAREGRPITPDARPVEIHGICRHGWKSDPPRTMLQVRCGSGTYIRALCRDLGQMVNSAAHMSFLLRTAAGTHHVNSAWTLEELDAWRPRDGKPSPVMDMGEALDFMPRITVDDARAVAQGRPPALGCRLAHGQLVRLYDGDGRFLAVARAEPSRGVLALQKVFAGGEGSG